MLKLILVLFLIFIFLPKLLKYIAWGAILLMVFAMGGHKVAFIVGVLMFLLWVGDKKGE